jgi:hypothetical protein
MDRVLNDHDAGSASTNLYREDEPVADLAESATHPQKTFFRATDQVPEATWYWLALGSIGISAVLKLLEKDHWALFVGQWPPTFLLFGLYHRLLKPGGDVSA